MTNVNYQEMYRPQYQFSPESNWMNDPNGMVYYEGEYHLFYQYHPHSTEWGPMHWGHAISKDLIYWEHLPIALKPDHNGFIFSGSVVVDWQDSTGFFLGKSGLVAIFTHSDMHMEDDESNLCTDQVRQRQSLAYSKDKGRTWTMYEGNPVLVELDIIDFRDPKVFWHAPDHRWVMVVAAGNHVRLYASENLKEWTFLSEFGLHEGSHNGVWECPDLFQLPVDGISNQTKWVLLISIGDDPTYPEGSRTQYFVGHFDGESFINDHSPETTIWLDHGRDNYAGVTWSDAPEGNRILIGWMSNWKYANVLPTSSWRSAMTLPRVLSLRCEKDGIRLLQTPVENGKHLRDLLKQWNNVTIIPNDNLLSAVQGELLEIEAEIVLDSATEFGFKLRTSDQQETIVGYDVHKQELFVDRTKSGRSDFHPKFRCRHSAILSPINQSIRLRIFVDWSSIEVFANDGRIVMTDLIYPDPSSRGLAFYSLNGSIIFRSLKIYKLKSIHRAI